MGAQVREGWSGYCQCVDGRQTYHVGCENHAPFTCEQACRVPEDWLCDPWWYDDSQCDVSCGSSDPDCTREVTVSWPGWSNRASQASPAPRTPDNQHRGEAGIQEAGLKHLALIQQSTN